MFLDLTYNGVISMNDINLRHFWETLVKLPVKTCFISMKIYRNM